MSQGNAFRLMSAKREMFRSMERKSLNLQLSISTFFIDNFHCQTGFEQLANINVADEMVTEGWSFEWDQAFVPLLKVDYPTQLIG